MATKTPGAGKWGGEVRGLHRVAALIGDDAGIDEILAATAAEAAALTGAERAAVVRHDTGTVTVWPPAARWASGPGDVSVDIRVGQELLGVVSVHAEPPFPPGIEQQLRGLAGLTAAALARDDLHRLTGEQAALRRVAMLVAGGAPPAEVFDAVVGEMGRLLGVGSVGLVRYDGSDHAVVLAGWGRLWEAVPRGPRLALGGDNVVTRVARTGESVRIDYVADGASGAIATQARRVDTRAAVGGPIFLGGELWGVMVAAALGDEAIPDQTELRLEQFTTLVATAIASSEARLELARLAEEQAALRRVATLVAEETPPADLFAKVAEEAMGVLPGEVEAAIHRYDPDGCATVVTTCGSPPPHGIRLGERIPLAGSSVIARVFREQRPVRVDFYPATEGAVAERAQRHGIHSAFGSPIVVHGRLWGAMIVANHDEDPFPADIERQVRPFTDLVATSIANAQAREERRRLADEQAALRRVATLVAGAAAPLDVFTAVVDEVSRLLGAAQVGLMRAESEDEVTIMAMRGRQAEHVAIGSRLPLDGESATAAVVRTGQSARVDLRSLRSGAIADLARRTDAEVAVAAPIVVEGRVWGAIAASWEGQELPPDDSEERLAEFAELLDTAIANAHGRDELKASRARVLTSADDARRRVVRDLHDGAQQRLVHTILTLKLAQRAFDADPEGAKEFVGDALRQAEDGNAELRELAHGLLPSVLTSGGLAAGVDSLVARMDLPVDVDVTTTRMSPEIEANAYFIVAEGLTNVVKHARATRAEVTAVVRGELLVLEIRDDGIGGGDPEGSGLLGVADRAAALGGRLRLESPPGAGTLLVAELPLA
jgi:signal transduction histidine kinase